MTEPVRESWNKGPIAWMARHGVAANLRMVMLLLGGFLMSFIVRQEVFPVFSVDAVQVLVPYPGASPEEVESALVLPVEEALAEVDGIDEIISTAKENVANIMVKALTGVDAEKLSREVQNAVDRITTFPGDAEKPVVLLMTMHRRGMNLVLHGPASEKSLQALAERFRDELLANSSITSVDLSGIRPLELSIELDEVQLRRHGLTLPQVSDLVRRASGDTPGGALKTTSGETLIRVQHRRDSVKEFSDLPLPGLGAVPIRLGDIAVIKDGYEEVDSSIRWNGRPAVLLDVNLQGDDGPVEISEAVMDVFEEFRLQLPNGIGLDVLYDDSESFEDRIDLLLRNAGLGLSLVFIMLSLLLRARLAFWVTLGIPISFLAALAFLPAFDVSINMVTLFAFIIALGIVVDDAVVVGENIYAWRRRGAGALEAAIRGAREVSIPVTFSILTNIAAFLPLAFVPGVSGKIFRLIPVVVILIFIASWIESLFILPNHLAHGKMKKDSRSPLKAISEGFQNLIEKRFTPIVRWVVNYRYAMLTVAVVTLVLCLATVRSGLMGFTPFPIVESDRAMANVTFPVGTPASITQKALTRIREGAETVLKKHHEENLGKGIIEVLGKGNSGGHLGELQVLMVDPELRETTVSSFVKLWREEVGLIAGAKSLVFQADFGGPGGGPGLTLQVRGHNLDELKEANERVIRFLRDYDMVRDIEDGFAEGKPQIDVKLKHSAEALGLSAEDIARQLRATYTGSEAMRQLRERNEVKVRVKWLEADRRSRNALETMVIQGPDGRMIPLSEAAHLQVGYSNAEIKRVNGMRAITIQSGVEPRELAGVIKGELEEKLIPELQQRYPGLRFSFEGRQKDMLDSLKVLGLGFILAVVAIYGLLAIPFNSYLQPGIIMFSIPFGIVGAVLGHIVMGYSLSIMSMFGVVALTGVVVNDSLVLVDLANRLIKDGIQPYEAVVRASVRRFRPIFLTSVTTFFGLAPMILETSPQARFLIPMAISLGFGIVFATVIALLIVPCLYIVLEDMKRWVGFLRKRREEGFLEA